MRSQGWSLDLQVESGQYALKKAGLFQEFKKHARYQGQELRIVDKTAELLFVRKSQEQRNDTADPNTLHNRPQIDRKVLRQMLIDSLPNGTIQEGQKGCQSGTII
ncbi:hypothetical protein NQZ79_g8218 [Umbelopsis isabellina]|nr:hypothetical protein NQZ79_g8218 [Umbelopsis isabellina]